MLKLLERSGFETMRIKGSHHFLKNKEKGLVTTVSVHKNEDLGAGMIKDILENVEMSKEEYEKLRKKRKN